MSIPAPTSDRLTIALQPEPVDLRLYRGDDAQFDLEIDGDLTAGTFASALRRKGTVPEANVDIEVTAELGADPAEPARVFTVLHILLPHTASVALVGAYVWDLQHTDAAGMVTTLFAGNVTVTDDVTVV